MFNLTTLRNAAEAAVTTGIATFVSSDFWQHAFTVHGLEVAAAAAGMAAGAVFLKTIGAVQAGKGALKVAK